MRRLLSIFTLGVALLLLPSVAWAQQGTITGTVTDAQSDETLPGATVQVVGEGMGTATSADGQYRITEVPAGQQTLRVSFVGYQPVERVVNVRDGETVTANFRIQPQTEQLEEVTVTGYRAVEQEVESGASSNLTSGEIQKQNIESATQALQGTTPGVRITSSSGQPGAAIDVQIRGTGSITGGTDPLFIVDGVQYSTSNPFTQSSGNPLANIDTDDIANIQVLRGAAAASIYGAQASNGVVLITTKSGRAGQTEISFSTSISRTQRLKEYDVGTTEEWANYNGHAYANALNDNWLDLGAFAQLVNGSTSEFVPLEPEQGREIAFNPGGPCIFKDNPPGFNAPALCDATLASGFGLSLGTDSLNTSWPDAVYRKAYSQNYDLSIRGGDEDTKFFVSGSFSNEQGQILDSRLRSGGIRTNVEHTVRSWLDVSAKLNVSSVNVRGTIEDGAFINSPFWSSYLLPPNSPIYNEPGNPDSGFNLNPNFVFTYNPVAQEEFNTRSSNNTQVNGSTALNWSLTDALNARTFGGLQFQDTKENNYEDPRLPPNAPSGGAQAVPQRRVINYNVSQTLTYDNTFDDVHSISSLLGTEYKKEEEVRTAIAAQTFPNEDFRTAVSAATPTTTFFGTTEFRQLSFFGDLEYTYDRTYQLRGTLRYDGNSRFGNEKRYGLFGTVSGYVRLSRLGPLENLDFLTDLKLRGSYGVTGNSQLAPSPLALGDNFLARRLQFGSSGAYNGQAAITPTSLGNQELTWEEKKEWNVGLDYAFFGGRVSGSIDAYTNRNEQLLLQRDLPGDSGYGTVIDNVGVLENRGLEFRVQTVNVDRAFEWTTDFNISFQDSEVAELLPGDDEIVSFAQPGGSVYRVGEAPGQYRLTPYAGVNPANGVPMYEDRNGNLTYDPTDTADDRLVGNTNPDFYGGLTNTFSFAGFSAEVFLQYDYGRTTFNNDAYFLESSTFFFNNRSSEALDDFWREPGQVTDTPYPTAQNAYGPFSGSTGASGFGSTRWLEDASYIRLKRVRLSYNLSSELLASVPGLSSANVYVQARNLLTFTNYTGFDPEVIGTGIGSYPQGKTFTGGLDLTF